MTAQDQVDALYAAQATTDLERELIDALPARIDPYRDATSHTVWTSPGSTTPNCFFSRKTRQGGVDATKQAAIPTRVPA